MKPQHFLQYVYSDIERKYSDISRLAVIFPNRRSITYFNNIISKQTSKPIFGPYLSSVDDFVFDVLGFNKIDSLALFFEFYEEYKDVQNDEHNIENCLKWADTLLKDFEDIDKYLVDKNIFQSLLDFKKIDNWDLELKNKFLTNDYISFFENIEKLYTKLTSKLIKKKTVYSGLAQRILAEEPVLVKQWLKKQNLDNILFVGLAGMTYAEEHLIDYLKQEDLCQFYWNTDKYFYENKNQEAGFFARKYFKKWNQKSTELKNDFLGKKNINIIGADNLVGQAKLLGDLLEKTNFNEGQITKTAVVLSDENLLFPVLESIPKEIKDINVTLGMPLLSLPIISLFESLFSLYTNSIRKSNEVFFYYKNIFSLIENPHLNEILNIEDNTHLKNLESLIKKEKLNYVRSDDLLDIVNSKENIVFSYIFNSRNTEVDSFIEMIILLIDNINSRVEKKNEFEKIQRDCLNLVKENFILLRRISIEYNSSWNLNVLLLLFKKMIQTQKINFEGEPVRGLQIMGLLETRNLDFDQVYVLSVNEEKIPANKSKQLSFLPFELKKQYGIITFIESDAIYANHFFNLIKKPTQSYLLYDKDLNSDLKSFERSRFIEQILYEVSELESEITISEKNVSNNFNFQKSENKKIIKDSFILDSINKIFFYGISPSTLNLYFYDSYKFYLEKILKVEEDNDLEAVMRSDTIGNIMHDVLESLYKPHINKVLTKEDIDGILIKLADQIKVSLIKEYKIGAIDKGKNVLIYSAIQNMLARFLKNERDQILSGNKIKILSLEAEYKSKFYVEGLNQNIILKGKIDRVDTYNGMTRIIDYKSGNMQNYDLHLNDMVQIKEKPKSLQVLFYALIYSMNNKLSEMQSGIIPLKNSSSNFMNLNYNTDIINQSTLNDFSKTLSNIFCELLDPDVPLVD